MYNVVSLFSGAMGLDLGLKKAGMSIKVTQDFESWCKDTAEANNVPHVSGDIKELIKNDPNCSFLLKEANINKEDVFLVAGGPPCQSFSTAGKRLGIQDPRGSLFMEFSHVVKTLRPRFFVMENVKGLLSSKVDPKDKNSKTALDVILEEFKALGYKIIFDVLNAVDYGVPQFRERLIIIGSRDNEPIFIPRPTHFMIHQDEKYRWKTVKSAIFDLENDPGEYLPLSKDREKYIKMVPMGGNWKDLPEKIIQEAMGGAYKSGGGKTGFYRRLSYNEPSPTLVTSPVQKATMLCHPTKPRVLSVLEYKRLQQFPDSWKIMGSLSNQYKQIGNAVPIGLGEAIGKMLISVANHTFEIKTKRYKSLL